MARVKVFVNGTDTKIISSEVKREGDRAIDEAKLELPASSAIDVSNCVEIVQDTVNLCGLVGAYMFQGAIRDESGKGHHGYGEIQTKRSDIRFNWCNTNSVVKNSGFKDITSICETGCMAGTCGKVTCYAMDFGNCACGYFSFNDCNYFQMTKTSPWTMSFWASSGFCGAEAIITNKVSIASTAQKGFALFKRSVNDLRIMFGDACANVADVTWNSINDLNDDVVRNYVLTYDGSQCSAGFKLYENGELAVATLTTNTLSCAGDVISCSNFFIGAATTGSNPFHGTIEDFQIYRGVELTAEQARAIFNEGVLGDTCGKFGDAVDFNGIESNLYITNNCDFQFGTGMFDIFVWAKWTGTQDGMIFTKRTTSCNGISLRTNTGGVGGEVRFRLNSTNLTYACGGYNDDAWHMIRTYRDSCSKIHLEVDNVHITCTTLGTTTNTCANFRIGNDYTGATFFKGQLNVIRIYKGVNLSAEQATRMYESVNASSLMKLSGKVTRVDKKIYKKEAIVHSHGEDLGTIEVQAVNYLCRSPEYIIEDLIKTNTCLIPHIHICATGITVARFNADGKLIDILKDLTQMSNKTFQTDALMQFHLHNPSFHTTCYTFTHGKCMRNFEEVYDDTEIVNDIVVIGETKRYDTSETFDACSCFPPDGCRTQFPLIGAPNGGAVYVDCVEQEPEICYEFCYINHSLCFLVAPAACTTVKVDYEYDITLIMKGSNTTSIATHGKHSKRFVMPWIRSREDGNKFISNFLLRYKDIRPSFKAEFGVMKNSVSEGDVITLVNSIKGVNGQYVVKSITWKYPEANTDMLLGEYRFDDLEYQAQITNKIHDLESILTEIKSICNTETAAECLPLCDSIVIYEAGTCGTSFSEALCICDTIVITVVSQGIYGDCVSEYNVVIYAS